MPPVGRVSLLSQLTQTYEWLNNRHTAAGDVLINLHAEPIFLNVDDLTTDTWRWCCADEMCFNLEDDATTTTRAVLEYLMQFKPLFTASNVQEIVDAPVFNVSRSDKAELHDRMRNAFDQKRSDGRFIDVIFVASDGSEHPAHRLYLSGIGDHFDTEFGGDFAEGSETGGQSESL